MDRSHPVVRSSVGVLLLIIALGVAACGASGAAAPQQEAAASAAAAPAASAGNRAGSGADNGSNDDGGTGNGTAADPGAGGTAGNGAFRDLAKIVYTGTLSLKVEDLDAAVKAGRDVVRKAGGFIGASRQSNDGDRSVASITYRIPADRWEEAVAALRELGSVLGEETNSTEVTGQIVDLEARIRNLRVSEAAIQAIAEKAVSFEEILEGQARLSEVRGQIEQLDAQRASLEEEAALGTLTVTYGREIVAVVRAVEEAAWNPAGEIDRATSTLTGILQTLTTAGIWFGIVWLPLLAVLFGLVLLGRLVLRRVGVLARISDPEIARPPIAPG